MKGARPPEKMTGALDQRRHQTPQAGVRKYIEVGCIRLDGGTQSRCEIDESTVAEYAEGRWQPRVVLVE